MIALALKLSYQDYLVEKVCLETLGGMPEGNGRCSTAVLRQGKESEGPRVGAWIPSRA